MKYRDETAFRQALQQRLKDRADGDGALLVRNRKRVAFDRLLARLLAVAKERWVLKGGFALDLRLPTRARSTKDVDIEWRAEETELLDVLLDAANYDAGDFFEFALERAGVPEDRLGGSHRFRVSASLAGRSFESFLLDVGFRSDDALEAETLRTDDFLGFAEIEPVEVQAVPLELQVAEKLHAYSRVYEGGRTSSRTKDLIDLALIAELSQLDAAGLRREIDTTKDKQDPTISFPSQRNECAEKAEELGGRIVCDFTDQEAGRRDDRVGWSELVREAKEPDARRFDAVIVYSTSRLSRELFHALAYERELARAGVEVFYARSAGDQTSPEGRLIRHMFQALDQFEVEKLGREVRRGQTENTRQGYRNGGRAPYGYRLRHEPHPDPRRARAGDTKSRLARDPEQAPVIVEMFQRFLAGSGYKEIADHLNRPGGPPPPHHVDSKRNTSGKWSKTTIRSMLENHVYTGRLYWNRLDFRSVKQGEGPLVRRNPEEWIEADQRQRP